MSTKFARGDGKAAQGPGTPQTSDRTWKCSQGISFLPPTNAIWTPQQGLRFSSSGTPNTESRATPLERVARQSSDDGTASLPTTNNHRSSQSSEYARLFTAQSLPGPSALNDELYPLLHPSLLAQRIEVFEADGESKSSEGNDNSSTPLRSGDDLFRSPLSFHIPEARLKSALSASAPNPAAYWQHTLYRGPGGDEDTVKVHYCRNKEKTETVAQLFLDEEVIGFDLEWKINPKDDSIKKNVALVQVASERRVALFHFARFPDAQVEEDFITPSLRKLLESPDIIKVGVNVKGDSTRLRNYLNIKCQGLFELSHLYKLVKFSSGDVKKINRSLVSLATQVQEHLQLPLWKGEVRSSDWSLELSYQQTQYAASDSYAGFQLFHVLESKRQAIDPTPPRPACAEANLPIRLADGQTLAAFNKTPETIEDSEDDPEECSDVSVEELTGSIGNAGLGDHPPPLESEVLVVSTAPLAVPSDPVASGEAYCENTVRLPVSPELSIANAWVEQYSQTRARKTTKACAKPADLRAYALWHKQGLDVPTVAKLLRVPPLQNTTVVSYICKAISLEMLPYECARIPELEQYIGPYGFPSPFRNKYKGLGGNDGKRS